MYHWLGWPTAIFIIARGGPLEMPPLYFMRNAQLVNRQWGWQGRWALRSIIERQLWAGLPLYNLTPILDPLQHKPYD